MAIRAILAVLLFVLACHARVLLVPGVSVPLLALVPALVGAAAVVLAAVAVRMIRRDGWQLYPCWRPA